MSKICPTCFVTFADTHAFCPTDGTTLRANDLESGFVGTIIADRYVITELLGEGGMGKVYLAQHVKLPRQAAIKVMHAHMVHDPAAMARFNREAANASRIDHENVARVFDYGETSDGLVYLAMEYITGPSLKQLLADQGPLSLARTAVIIRQVASGLDAAHKLGIVHRDLKPDNIIVMRGEDGGDKCKVVDFGIAKAIGSGEKSLTQTGFVIGTPEYMSPEQLMGEEIDPRSDEYALALVAYQCLTGETPFDSNTPDRGMMARLTSQPRSLGELRPQQSWPGDVQVVLNKALDRQRAQRFESAGAFAVALDRALTTPVAAPVAPAPAPKAAPKPPAPKPVKTPPPTPPRAAPVAIPTPVRAPLRAQPVISREEARQTAPRPARRRILPRMPYIPIVRWGTTALIVGFGWLVLTEGSITRAFRRATSIARSAESNAKQMADRAQDVVADASTTRGDPKKPGVGGVTPTGAPSKPGDSTAAPTAAPKPAAAAGARAAIDSLAEVLSGSGVSAGVAGEALSKLESLLPRATSSDSVWAYLRMAKAHHLMGQNPAACSANAIARRLASTDAQKESVKSNDGAFECTP